MADAFSELSARLKKRTRDDVQHLQKRVVEYVERAQTAEDTIDKATRDYINGGVSYIDNRFQQAMALMGETPGYAKEYFRLLAAERGRPFIHAQDITLTGYMGGKYREVMSTQLTVPASAKLKGLVSGLTLVAQNKPLWEAPITTAHSERLWRFNFIGDGRTTFLEFLTMCRENRVMRIILRLPPPNLPAR